MRYISPPTPQNRGSSLSTCNQQHRPAALDCHPVYIMEPSQSSKTRNPLQKITLMKHLVKPEGSGTAPYKCKIAAFTLVEMSIILIVIGLIIAGITKGQEMVKAAKVQSAISKMQKYTAAINMFSLKYDALPGDLKNATDYWPSVTVSGNGNGIWDDPIYEGLRAWEHLSLSKMIDENYDLDVGFSQYETGVTLPASPFGSRWHFNTSTITSNVAGKTYTGSYLKISNGDNNVHWLAGVTVEDSIAIDKKIDDGISNSGRVLALNGGAIPCIYNDNYIKSNTGMGCQLVFKLD